MLRLTSQLLRIGRPPPSAKKKGPRQPMMPAAHRPFQGGQPMFHRLLLEEANAEAAKLMRQQKAAAAGYADGVKGDAAAGGGAASMAGKLTPKLPLAGFLQDRANPKSSSAKGPHDPDAVAALQLDMESSDTFEAQRAFNELADYEAMLRQRGGTMPATASKGQKVLADAATVVAEMGGAGSGPADEVAGSTLPAEVQKLAAGAEGDDEAAATDDTVPELPDDVNDAGYFEKTYGYSMLKGAVVPTPPTASQPKGGIAYATNLPPVDTTYSTFDLWAEQPKYNLNTYFLYIVARRRNVYAVMYTHAGKRVLPVYSAGNRGLKDTDRGFRHEGSAEVGHAVMSAYLTDVIPKLKELEAAGGGASSGDSKKKFELVVRVLGFYNGRTGAVRAISDASEQFEVRTLEDITPFPLNGPRLPKRRRPRYLPF